MLDEYIDQFVNTAGRLPENIRNSSVDLQSQNDSNRPKRNFFLLKEMLYFD